MMIRVPSNRGLTRSRGKGSASSKPATFVSGANLRKPPAEPKSCLRDALAARTASFRGD